jgi:Fe-S cluster assembly ATPase SufC
MKKNTTKMDPEEIAIAAENGKDVNQYFSGGELKPPLKPKIQRVNVDFALPMLHELDEYANRLNISRQAVIKSLLKEALDAHKAS